MNKADYKFKCLKCGRVRRWSNIEICSVCRHQQKAQIMYKSPYPNNRNNMLLNKKEKVHAGYYEGNFVNVNRAGHLPRGSYEEGEE